MEYSMKLNAQPFERIKAGTKRVELRLFDEKRQGLRIGDTLVLSNVKTGEQLCAKIVDLQRFKDFFRLYQSFDKAEMGYAQDEEAHAEDMYAYYAKEDIARYGVLAICIEVI